MREIIGGSSRELMDALCQRFIASGNYREIFDILSSVEGLNKRVQNLASCGWLDGRFDVPESSISRAIHTVVKALEDLLLNAMEGNDLSELARNGHVLYQVAPDVALQ